MHRLILSLCTCFLSLSNLLSSKYVEKHVYEEGKSIISRVSTCTRAHTHTCTHTHTHTHTHSTCPHLPYGPVIHFEAIRSERLCLHSTHAPTRPRPQSHR